MLRIWAGTSNCSFKYISKFFSILWLYFIIILLLIYCPRTDQWMDDGQDEHWEEVLDAEDGHGHGRLEERVGPVLHAHWVPEHVDALQLLHLRGVGITSNEFKIW